MSHAVAVGTPTLAGRTSPGCAQAGEGPQEAGERQEPGLRREAPALPSALFWTWASASPVVPLTPGVVRVPLQPRSLYFFPSWEVRPPSHWPGTPALVSLVLQGGCPLWSWSLPSEAGLSPGCCDNKAAGRSWRAAHQLGGRVALLGDRQPGH